MKYLLTVLCLAVTIGIAHAGDATLTWTAPFDSSGVSKYDMRYSLTKPDTTSQATKDLWWTATTTVVVPNMPTPTAAGSTQSVILLGLKAGSYYFVIRSKDIYNNWSDWSNVALKFIVESQPPIRIIDLR